MHRRQSPRDRLIDTAATLFYERGLPNVGINEVTDRAGVARMTLYNNFSSKDDLALAAFERQGERRRTLIEVQTRRHRTAPTKIAALFDVADRLASESHFCGCAFINVILQQPDPDGRMHALARAHKHWIKAKILHWVDVAGARNSDRLAQQILALWDGSVVESYIQGTREPIAAARQAAVTLFKGALAERTV